MSAVPAGAEECSGLDALVSAATRASSVESLACSRSPGKSCSTVDKMDIEKSSKPDPRGCDSTDLHEPRRRRCRLWNRYEDAALLDLVNRATPPYRWVHIAASLCDELDITRSPKQCRDRFVNFLDPVLGMGAYTKNELIHLWYLYDSFGPQWAKNARQMVIAGYPRRSPDSLKNRVIAMREGRLLPTIRDNPVQPRPKTKTKTKTKSRTPKHQPASAPPVTFVPVAAPTFPGPLVDMGYASPMPMTPVSGPPHFAPVVCPYPMPISVPVLHPSGSYAIVHYGHEASYPPHPVPAYPPWY